MVAAPVLPKLPLPGAGVPSSVRRRILPSGWSGSWAGVQSWRSIVDRNRYCAEGENTHSPRQLGDSALEVLQTGRRRGGLQPRFPEGQAPVQLPRLGIQEIDALV